LVYGYKQNETRSWGTFHRGPLAIHAAKTDECLKSYYVEELMRRADLNSAEIEAKVSFTRGCVIGITELVDCVRTETIRDKLSRQELALGDYSDGRFAWITKNQQWFKEPVPCRGYQQLFDVAIPPQVVSEEQP
jgi:hypothetical protein